ncbi:DUF3861 domain-containing protein [Lysobacter sp. cf310]|uniref:DUF3861 domain-containing protein n=1 Tax=Lysobacter sp. cf310 TaxID=1761790 RepID=UPI0008EEC692|nr:DUF3861 domain-containing protein [Lysobacter sp. cf310]SFK53152.1 protein of unknown function [Lysobacter sp. cf310]
MTSHRSHRYRVRVTALGESEAEVSFEVEQHDDLLAIVQRVRDGSPYSSDDAGALAIGLKLFSGVMLAHRDDPLFADIRPAVRVLIGNLKSRVGANGGAP